MVCAATRKASGQARIVACGLSSLQRDAVGFAVDWQVCQLDGLAISRACLGDAAVVDIDHRLDSDQAHQRAPGVIAIAADTSIRAEEVFSAITIRKPVIHKQMHTLLREGSLQLRRCIALHALKHQVIHGSPDGSMPVRLSKK